MHASKIWLQWYRALRMPKAGSWMSYTRWSGIVSPSESSEHFTCESELALTETKGSRHCRTDYGRVVATVYSIYMYSYTTLHCHCQYHILHIGWFLQSNNMEEGDLCTTHGQLKCCTSFQAADMYRHLQGVHGQSTTTLYSSSQSSSAELILYICTCITCT